MHSTQPALFENSVRRRGEGAVAEIQLLDGQSKGDFAGH
jgi:hypothetical protein